MTSQPNVSPLRQRMIDDMRMRQLSSRTQANYLASCAGSPDTLGARLIMLPSRTCGVTSCIWPITARHRCR
jgi:hypothetical protein